MKERDLSICLEMQVEVKPVNFCRFNDFPEEIQEVEAVKGFSNKADQDCQTEVSGEHLKLVVFCYLFCMRVLQVLRENSSTVVFAFVTFTYAAFVVIHCFQGFVGHEKAVFVYGFQTEDFKGFVCCKDQGNGDLVDCQMRKTLGMDLVDCGEFKENNEIFQDSSLKVSGLHEDLKKNAKLVELDSNETLSKEKLKNEDFSNADQ